MNDYKNDPAVMVDLETLGTSNESVFFQIGVVFFDRVKYNVHAVSDIRISIEDSIEKGRTKDSSTVNWWNNRERKSLYAKLTRTEDQIPLVEALEHFEHLMAYYRPKTLWCHPNFDWIILADAFNRQLGRAMPMRYWTARDVRTVEDCFAVNRKEAIRNAGLDKVILHDAVADCLAQLAYLRYAFKITEPIGYEHVKQDRVTKQEFIRQTTVTQPDKKEEVANSFLKLQ